MNLENVIDCTLYFIIFILSKIDYLQGYNNYDDQ